MPSLLRQKLFWVALLYFGEGTPLGVFYDLFPVYFRQQGVNLTQIGLISLLGLAWTLKFLWAPLVDWLRGHRRWIAAANVGMALTMMVFATSPTWGPWAWLVIGAFALLSATCDIATDGYTIEWLNRAELGLANGVRIGFYRVGMLMAGLVLALSTRMGWSAAFMLGGLLLLGNALVALLAPGLPAPAASTTLAAPDTPVATTTPTTSTQPLPLDRGREGLLWLLALGAMLLALLWPLWLVLLKQWRADYQVSWWLKVLPPVALLLGAAWLVRWLRAARSAAQGARAATVGAARDLASLPQALRELLGRTSMSGVIAFILLYKVGDSSAGFMIKPFWLDSGFSAEQIGLVSVNLGLGLSIAGGIVGGWYVDRRGVWRALWVLGLWQALSNLGYALAAELVPQVARGVVVGWSLPWQHQALVYGASACESFTAGLGTAAFLAFLMRITDKRRAATEYAILSSIFAFSRSLAGGLGGVGAEQLGYASFFALSFLLCFPAFFFLRAARRQLEQVPWRD